MNLTAAINTFNKVSEPKIELHPTRDGRVMAKLPRTGRQIMVEPSQFDENIKVTAGDVALLCEEARRAFAPGMALLTAALGALKQLDKAS